MMRAKICVFFILFSLGTLSGFGQELVVANFVITINDNLFYPSSISNYCLSVRSGPNLVRRIEVEYYPGYFAFSESDQQWLSHSKPDSIFLEFTHYTYTHKRQESREYKIPFSMEWTKLKALVIKIYDLDRGKYKNVFVPIEPGKKYTYELETHGGGQLTRVRIGKVKAKYLKR